MRKYSIAQHALGLLAAVAALGAGLASVAHVSLAAPPAPATASADGRGTKLKFSGDLIESMHKPGMNGLTLKSEQDRTRSGHLYKVRTDFKVESQQHLKELMLGP